jgi:glycosyltransferase involved in cell wall biosynthesis
LRRYELDSSFHLLGLRSDIPRLLAAADVLAVPSLDEGFPNAVGEAMASTVPCVASEVGDAALLIGDTGVTVQPNNAEALAAGVKRLIALSEQERRALGYRARQRIADNFEIGDVARRYSDFYDRLYEQTRTPELRMKQ